MGRRSTTTSSSGSGTGAMLLMACAAALLMSQAHAGATRTLSQAATPVTCPISSENVLLNFTEVKASCATAAANSSAFCDACSCAIFTAFTPALQATGLVNTTSSGAVNQGVELVGSCVNAFLAQFVAADVDVQALVALGSCQYADDQVPTCLQQRVTALSNRLTAGASDNATVTSPAPSPAVAASGGPPPGDFRPDDGEPGEIVDAVNNGTAGPDAGAPVASPPPSPSLVSVIITEPGAGGNPLTDPTGGTVKVSPGSGAVVVDNGGGSPSSAQTSGPNAARLVRPGLASGVLASMGAATVLLLALA